MARGGAFIRRRARLDLSADEDDEVFEEGDAAEEHGDGDRDRMREGIHLKYRWFNFWLDHASMHINDRIARLCDLYKARYLPSFYTGRNNISENCEQQDRALQEAYQQLHDDDELQRLAAQAPTQGPSYSEIRARMLASPGQLTAEPSDAAPLDVSMSSNDEQGSQCSLPTSIESSASAQEARRLRDEAQQAADLRKQVESMRLEIQAEKEQRAAAEEQRAAAEQRAATAEAAAAVLHTEAEAANAALQASHFAVKMPSAKRKKEPGVARRFRKLFTSKTGIMTEPKNIRLRQTMSEWTANEGHLHAAQKAARTNRASIKKKERELANKEEAVKTPKQKFRLRRGRRRRSYKSRMIFCGASMCWV